jgi:hypothetical protein
MGRCVPHFISLMSIWNKEIEKLEIVLGLLKMHLDNIPVVFPV